ncbi:hypothetical protein ABW365_02110 [Enterococcus avium]
MKRIYRYSGLIIPNVKQLESLVRLIKRETSLEFTNACLKECLWPLFSHQLLLNRKQQALVHKRNRRLANFYHTHYLLLEAVSDLLSTPLSQNEMVKRCSAMNYFATIQKSIQSKFCTSQKKLCCI